MNAPQTFDLGAPRAEVKTPGMIVRDLRFGRGEAPKRRWWLNGDPIATAWMTALSATFPKGEAFFIESVKAHRDGADPRLDAEIRAFVKQEINHTREHLAFNRMAAEAGYDFTGIDARVDEMLAMTRERPQILNLAVTMALEHFTAVLGHDLLTNPDWLEGADGDAAQLWKWHAAEEIEHKAVAYDTWLHATRGWSRWQRWKVKSIMMLVVTRHFFAHRIEDALDLLAQDGLTGWRVKARLFGYLFVSPGLLRKLVPHWLAWFMPGFHPWKRDDRALIQRFESEYAAAVMPAA